MSDKDGRRNRHRRPTAQETAGAYVLDVSNADEVKVLRTIEFVKDSLQFALDEVDELLEKKWAPDPAWDDGVLRVGLATYREGLLKGLHYVRTYHAIALVRASKHTLFKLQEMVNNAVMPLKAEAELEAKLAQQKSEDPPQSSIIEVAK